jgi:hypothetical protein
MTRKAATVLGFAVAPFAAGLVNFGPMLLTATLALVGSCRKRSLVAHRSGRHGSMLHFRYFRDTTIAPALP